MLQLHCPVPTARRRSGILLVATICLVFASHLVGPQLAVAQQPIPEKILDEVPVTGEILPGSAVLDRLDQMMKQIIIRHGVPGAALAITHQGKLLVARGYGWADVEARQPVEPTTLFGLASVSKPITGVTILKLVESGQLHLNDKVLELLGQLHAPPGHVMDPRLREITVRMLLEHAGGWDRTKNGDPCTYGGRVRDQLKVPLPINIDELIYYMNGQPLDFAPGTEQRYSNFGFAILGRIIEQVTGRPYVQYVEQNTLQPMGIGGIKMAAPRSPNTEAPYLPDEAKRYIAGTAKPLEGGHPVVSEPAGGWCGSAVALAKFMTAIDGTRTGKTFLDTAMMEQMLARPKAPLEIRKNGSWFGLGWDAVRLIPTWPFNEDEPNRAAEERPREGGEAKAERADRNEAKAEQSRQHNESKADLVEQRRADILNLAYGKDGGLPGISTWVQHLPGGIDWVVLFNGSEHRPAHPEEAERPTEAPQPNALQQTQKEVLELLRDVREWPRGDLFEKYR